MLRAALSSRGQRAADRGQGRASRCFPSDGADAESLLKNAEAALKKAKASGERYLFYTQQMTERAAEKLALENQLRQALENEEFVLHYQPKVDLETRRACRRRGADPLAEPGARPGAAGASSSRCWRKPA